MKHRPYLLSEKILENAKITRMMFNEVSSMFFVKKTMTKQILSSIALIGP